MALIEQNWNGHNPGFFRLYCRALLESGCRVVALCPRPDQVRGWNPDFARTGQLDAEEMTDEVLRHRWIRKVPQLAMAFRFKQHAVRLAAWEANRGGRVDVVFFACLYDGVAPLGGMDEIFPYPWTGLLLDSGTIRLRPSPATWLRYRSFAPLALFRARGCIALGNLDRFICDALGRRTGKPVHWLPEAVDEASPRMEFELAESLRAQAAGRLIVGCFGQFARRKGALEFLRLAEACHGEPWLFVWVGAMEENSFSAPERRWIKTFLAKPPANCRVVLGRVADEADFNALVALADVLYLRYHRHPGSSNMIGKAAAFEKRVLVSEGYCMADQTRRYDLGLCVPEVGTAPAHAALRRLLAPAANGLPPARFAGYRADHSPAAFAEAIRDLIGGPGDGAVAG